MANIENHIPDAMAEAVIKAPGNASKALMSILRLRLTDKDAACIKGFQRIGTPIDITHGVQDGVNKIARSCHNAE